jgi:hypothetical protein
MSKFDDSESDSRQGAERRSSVRASSLLPCSFRAIDESEVPAVEARILDLAVVEGDSSVDDQSMWDERSDELDREVALVLNEVRALRRKLAEIQRMMERQDHEEMKSRWVTINDRGFHATVNDGEEFGFEVGQLIEVELQIPSVHTRNILAVGEVIRIDGEESEKGEGFAAEFRSISRIHEKAIMRYALIRERHLARSDRFTDD